MRFYFLPIYFAKCRTDFVVSYMLLFAVNFNFIYFLSKIFEVSLRNMDGIQSFENDYLRISECTRRGFAWLY